MISFSLRSARLRSSHSLELVAILVRQCTSASCSLTSLRMRFSITRAAWLSLRVSCLNACVRCSVDSRYALCACSKWRSSSSIMPSSWILSTLYSSELRFLISSRAASYSCRSSFSESWNSDSILAIMSCMSFFWRTCAFTISVRSASNSSSSALSCAPNSASSARMRWCCRSSSESSTIMCARTASPYCSSASSRSRSSICTIASLRSTSRSWFWLRISISLLSSSTLAMRMILRHWLWILMPLRCAYRCSRSARSRSATRASSCSRRSFSSACSAAISSRARRSSSVSFSFLTFAPPFTPFFILAIATSRYKG
mmetsp:Transcript_264/g.622  ORF Transcript_264/g.622 Transcript_264/m.622 type:complete len:315 (-) Transcript_264:204-1148(-)